MLEGEEIVADGERVIITEEEDEDGMGIVTTLRITKVSSFTKVSIKGGGAISIQFRNDLNEFRQ